MIFKKIIKDIAELFGVETPNINMVWNWYNSVIKENGIKANCFSLDENISKEEFIKTYL